MNRKKGNPKEIFNSELAVDAGCESQGVFNPNAIEKVTLSIDPDLVHVSAAYRRADNAFKGKAFKTLRDSIKASNGNIQPIHVRKLRESELIENSLEMYELIEGQQRLVAAKENKQEILAFVFDDLDEFSRYVINITANISKNTLRPYELGCNILSITKLDPKISLEKVGKIIGFDKSTVSLALQLAKLDLRIVESFDSPCDLAYRDAPILRSALESNSGNVLTEALLIKDERKNNYGLNIKKSEVMTRLVNASSSGSEEPLKESKRTIILDDNSDVEISFGPKGVIIKSNLEMDSSREIDFSEKIKELLNKFMSQNLSGSETDFGRKEDLSEI